MPEEIAALLILKNSALLQHLQMHELYELLIIAAAVPNHLKTETQKELHSEDYRQE
jgi:hypothetical protein